MAMPSLEDQVLVALWQEHNKQIKLDPLVPGLVTITRSSDAEVTRTLRSLHSRGMLTLLEDSDGGVSVPVNASLHGKPGWPAAMVHCGEVTNYWEDRG